MSPNRLPHGPSRGSPRCAARRRRGPSTALAVAAALVAALAGCASTPPAPEPTLTVSEARRTPPLEPVAVRWGGTIAEVRNTAAGTTELEVVSRPLRRGGRPIRNDVTEGRFLAEVDGFLDPEIVREGRDVTVTGLVTGVREGQVGESPYVFPLVNVDDYSYWKPEPIVRPAHFPHPGLGGHYHHPFDPFWYDWPHPLYHHHYHRGSGASVTGVVRF